MSANVQAPPEPPQSRTPAELQRRAAAASAASAHSLVPVAAAFVVGAVVLLATGFNPVAAYRLLFVEAFGDLSRLASTLTSATPLIFTGLATAAAFRAGVFNIGVEGSLYLGALAAAVIGFTFVALPAPVLVAAALAGGAVAGMTLAAVAGWLRAYWGVDEVVTTLLLTFVAILLTGFLVNTYFLAPGVANSVSPLVAEHARLPRLLPPSTVNAGLMIGLVMAVVYYLWVRRSVSGYQLRMVGDNPRFALAHGIRVHRVIMTAMLVSGAIGGLGGATYTLGVTHRFVEGFSPDYGFTGIAVALLGRHSAIGCVLAAILFGALASAGSTVQLFSDLPLDLVRVLQGTVMIFAVVQIVRWPRGRSG